VSLPILCCCRRHLLATGSQGHKRHRETVQDVTRAAAEKSQADRLKVVNEAHRRGPLGLTPAVRPGPRTGEPVPA